ncbi:hypothetical protein BEP19_16100 [Ammoniphilus oxalaticus]|uniref:Uncharacterized protein n=1 Tax=Ammoniphilus oxalaticus TaxID=66863 RepID=A0A419SQH1_9BACL|nr:hypothetical protein [Ammoniphilus oxalaticus]RKD26723.1 hypothetical protein BEP19_16100 [Ammoniphilus oxalaticus]
MQNRLKGASESSERRAWQTLMARLTYNVAALTKYHPQLMRALPKDRQQRLCDELKGIERLTAQVVSRMKHSDRTYVRVKIGGNWALLSRTVFARSRRMRRGQLQRAFGQGRTKRIIDQLRYLRVNVDDLYKGVCRDTRYRIFEILHLLDRKYTFYLVSSMNPIKPLATKKEVSPIPPRQQPQNRIDKKEVSRTLTSKKKVSPIPPRQRPQNRIDKKEVSRTPTSKKKVTPIPPRQQPQNRTGKKEVSKSLTSKKKVTPIPPRQQPQNRIGKKAPKRPFAPKNARSRPVPNQTLELPLIDSNNYESLQMAPQPSYKERLSKKRTLRKRRARENAPEELLLDSVQEQERDSNEIYLDSREFDVDSLLQELETDDPSLM